MTHFDVSSMGLRVQLLFGEECPPDFVDRVRIAWADATVEGDVESDFAVEVPTPGDEDVILERLSVDVTLGALAHRRGHALMFHAAGLADDDGQVIAFIGPSGRGKTTASRFLAQHYGYVSDETIAIGEDGAVYSYRKPLSVVRPGLPKSQLAGSTLGLRPLPERPLRLVALVLLDRIDGSVAPRLERTPFVVAALELIAQMSYFPSLPSPFEQLSRLVDSVGGVFRLTYSEAEELLPVVRDLFAGAVAPSLATTGVRLLAVAADGVGSLVLGPTVDDAFDLGEKVLVLADRTVHVLDGIAPEIWRGVAAGHSEQQIVDAVVARYGAPPEGDPGSFVLMAIDELVSAGLLAQADAILVAQKA